MIYCLLQSIAALFLPPGVPILGVPNSKPIAQCSSARTVNSQAVQVIASAKQTIGFYRPFLAYLSDEK